MAYIYAKRLPKKEDLPDPITTAILYKFTSLFGLGVEYELPALKNNVRDVLVEKVAWGLEREPLCAEVAAMKVLSLMIKWQHGMSFPYVAALVANFQEDAVFISWWYLNSSFLV